MADLGTPMPFIIPQWFTNAGAVMSGYKLYSYAAGTSSKLSTYTTAAMTVANANPTILDSFGRANIFLPPGVAFKFVMAPPSDTDPPVAPIWTADNISSIPQSTVNTDVQGRAGENITANNAVYLSDGSGGTTAGRWYKASTANAYSSVNAPMVGMAVADISTGAFGAIRRAGRLEIGGALTDGATYYIGSTPGTITAVPPAAGTPRRVIGVADTLVSLLVMGESAKAVIRPRIGGTFGSVATVGASETTLLSVAIPAAAITEDGQSLKLHVFGTTANNANVKTIRVKIGANAIMTFVPTASEAGRWVIDAVILRSGAAAAQTSTRASVGPANGPVSREGTNTGAGVAAAWAAGDTIVVTGQGTSDNDIIAEGSLLQQFD